MKIHIANLSLIYKTTQLCELYALSLRDLGHEVSLSVSAVEDRLNLIVWPRSMLEQKGRFPKDYILLALEIWDGATLSNGAISEEMHARLEAMVSGARSIWTTFKAEKYDHPNVQYIGYGWHPGVERLKHQDKMIDVCFFGNISKRRLGYLLSFLAEHLTVSILPGHTRHQDRDHAIETARAVVNISHGPEFQHASPQRTIWLANNRVRMLSDETADLDGYLAPHHMVRDLVQATVEWTKSSKPIAEGNMAYEIAAQTPMVDRLRNAL